MKISPRIIEYAGDDPDLQTVGELDEDMFSGASLAYGALETYGSAEVVLTEQSLVESFIKKLALIRATRAHDDGRRLGHSDMFILPSAAFNRRGVSLRGEIQLLGKMDEFAFAMAAQGPRTRPERKAFVIAQTAGRVGQADSGSEQYKYFQRSVGDPHRPQALLVSDGRIKGFKPIQNQVGVRITQNTSGGFEVGETPNTGVLKQLNARLIEERATTKDSSRVGPVVANWLASVDIATLQRLDLNAALGIDDRKN